MIDTRLYTGRASLLSIIFKQHHYLILAISLLVMLTSNCSKKAPATVSDIDGNIYRTVVIGSQVWMAEDLRVTRYRNGEPVFHISRPREWIEATEGAYCFYNNDSTRSKERLYNWYAVNDNRLLAPEGWHIPTDEEIQELIDYLGEDENAGDKMKIKGATFWRCTNRTATNESKFSALANGYRHGYYGTFNLKGYNAGYWTSTENESETAWLRMLNCTDGNVSRSYVEKRTGLSIRCIMD